MVKAIESKQEWDDLVSGYRWNNIIVFIFAKFGEQAGEIDGL